MGALKIGFVLDDTLDTPDGVQQYVLTLGAWLSAEGHNVHYLVGNTTRTDIKNVHSLSKNIKVTFNGNRMSTPLPAKTRQIRDLLKSEQFDVLHVQMPYSPFMAAKVINAAPASTVIVGTFHVAPLSKKVVAANRVLGKFLNKSLKRFDAAFSVSTAAAELAKKSYGLETSIIPNVVKISHFQNAKGISVKANQKTVVFLGRLVPRKGCQVLLEALNKMKDQPDFHNLKVYICGDGILRQSLESYCHTNGLDSCVTFVGFVTNDQKASYLKSADVAVFPSTGGECFGIVLLEAMAADHPVALGADNEGYRTVLAPHPKSLFPVLDASTLAKKIQLFLTNDEERQATLAWQQQYIHQFDVATVGRRLISRYNQLLRQKNHVR